MRATNLRSTESPLGAGNGPGQDRVRPRSTRSRVAANQNTKMRRESGSRPTRGKVGTKRSEAKYVEVDPDGSDSWKLDAVIDMLQNGAVGIIPTDTFPALVCDVEDRQAVERLFRIKQMDPAVKQLSILCRNFSDIDAYTHGFPAPREPGDPDLFRMARSVLPGPFTLILAASRLLPRQCIDHSTGKLKARRTVGVRMPADPVCQAVLQGMSRPLLCTSVQVEECEDGTCPVEVAEGARMQDVYGSRGLDFVVDAGVRVAVGSTILDMTDGVTLVRRGRGDPSLFKVE